MADRRLNVVLAMPRTLAMDDSTPPLSLLMLAAVAEDDHDVRIVFPVDIDAAIAALPQSLAGADVFGLSVNSFSWYAARGIIAAVRRHHPRIRIVLGGPHPTHHDGHALATTAADAVVRGEGEVTFPELLRVWASGRDPDGVGGVTWKDAGGGIHENPDRELLTEAGLDALPLPAYHLVPPRRYAFASMETSRGCRFRCVFCAIPFRGIRQFSLARVEKVVRRIETLRNRFTTTSVFLSDDSFSAHRERVEGTLRLFRAIAPDWRIGCEARISELLQHDLLPHFTRTSIYLMQVGVECGYDEGWKRIKKGLTRRMVREFALQVAKLPFHYSVYWSFIIGLPWEGEAEVLETINFAFNTARAAGSQQPQVNPFSPYPGSPIGEHPEEFGLGPIEPSLYDDASWFGRFIGYSRVKDENRAFLAQYLQAMHNDYPRCARAPVVRFPAGPVMENPALQWMSP